MERISLLSPRLAHSKNLLPDSFKSANKSHDGAIFPYNRPILLLYLQFPCAEHHMHPKTQQKIDCRNSSPNYIKSRVHKRKSTTAGAVVKTVYKHIANGHILSLLHAWKAQSGSVCRRARQNNNKSVVLQGHSSLQPYTLYSIFLLFVVLLYLPSSGSVCVAFLRTKQQASLMSLCCV